MAGWISSRLKVAETFLQQIDQQAAESLRKNDKPRPEELVNETPTKTGGVVPLKDQLKKKTPERNDSFGNSRMDSDSEGLHRYTLKEMGTPAKNFLTPKPTLTDSDWTELLSTPKQPKPIAANRRSERSVVRGFRKDVKKQSSDFGISPVEATRKQKIDAIILNSTQRLDVASKNRVNGSSSDDKRSEGEESILSDSMERKSITNLQNGDGSPVVGEHDWMSDGSSVLLEQNQERRGTTETYEGVNQSHSELYPEKNSIGEAVQRSVDISGPIKAVSVSGANGVISEMNRKINDDEKISKSVAERRDKSNVALGRTVQHDMHRGSSSTRDGSSDTDSDSGSTSDSDNERVREEKARRREQIMAEQAAARAAEAIKERENIVARLEGEKQSLEKILEERAKQQAQEASELQMSMMETMEAVELEKQKHNTTRMEALTRLAKLETVNANLARSLATKQWNLEVEVNRVADLRQQIELKEVAHEELRRKMSKAQQSGLSVNQLEASKGFEFEKEILEAEYSFICDKIGQLQDKAKELEVNIEMMRKEIENPTEVEVELKKRLEQLTDHLIQKQVQVESLSSEKATLLFRIETVSRLLDENKSMPHLADLTCPGTGDDLESGTWEYSNLRPRPLLRDRIQSGGQHFESLLRQLDAIFSAGAAFLRRNSKAKLWSLIYIVCLHFWVVYILLSHSQPSDETKSGAVISLETINNTASI